MLGWWLGYVLNVLAELVVRLLLRSLLHIILPSAEHFLRLNSELHVFPFLRVYPKYSYSRLLVEEDTASLLDSGRKLLFLFLVWLAWSCHNWLEFWLLIVVPIRQSVHFCFLHLFIQSFYLLLNLSLVSINFFRFFKGCFLFNRNKRDWLGYFFQWVGWAILFRNL